MSCSIPNSCVSFRNFLIAIAILVFLLDLKEKASSFLAKSHVDTEYILLSNSSALSENDSGFDSNTSDAIDFVDSKSPSSGSEVDEADSLSEGALHGSSHPSKENDLGLEEKQGGLVEYDIEVVAGEEDESGEEEAHSGEYGLRGEDQLSGVEESVSGDYLSADTLGNEDLLLQLEQAPTRTYHVFQVSGTDVGSTITVNILTGLFEGRDQYKGYLECKQGNYVNDWMGRRGAPMNSTVVTKTHCRDVDRLTELYGPEFDRLFFIGNNRRDKNTMLPSEYCAGDTYPNVMCLEYEDLQYDDEAGLRRVVRFVIDRIRASIPYFSEVELLEEEAVQRMLDFAKMLAGEIPDSLKKYGVGGGNSRNHTLNSGGTLRG